MVTLPERVQLANLPTKIERLERLSRQLQGPTLYIKRDDQTGTELSGNKIRKLEFALKEALDRQCDTLITCGGLQSNHCRATAAAAARLGLQVYLVLSGSEQALVDGNLFLDRLLGANLRFITPEAYRLNRGPIMEQLKQELEAQGKRPYLIPEGASNGIGSFGYFQAMQEILVQEQELDISFDGVVLATGSGGTYAGLLLAGKLLGHPAVIHGFSVNHSQAHFQDRILQILEETKHYHQAPVSFQKEDIHIHDGYVGRGYAQSRPEELRFIRELAALEGIILDPVYTGKALYGLTEEIKKGHFSRYQNLLFLHTGGLFGLFPARDQFY